MHTITTRSANPEESRQIATRTGPDFASYGCLCIFFGVIPAYLLGTLGGWVGSFHSGDAAAYGRWIGWLLSAVLCVSAFAWFLPYERRLRRRAARDDHARIIQEIHVVNARVIELALISDNEPILAFDIGDGKILYLQGQWLRDPNTYGAASLEGDPIEQFINGLPTPHSFPSSEFTVSRFPHSGDVLGIRVVGAYAAPQAVVEALKPELEFGDSELLEGSLDDIAAVLVREHERRRSK
jgi:hypothetical protein